MTLDTSSILSYLGVAQEPPSLSFLDKLVAAYAQRIPWETASRLSRQKTIVEVSARARDAAQFWQSAMKQQTGGTCFESNGAFFPLLQQLGFEGYLTINDMKETYRCHTACVIVWEGEKWLVDVGYPLYLPIKLDVDRPSTRLHPVHDFTATPLSSTAGDASPRYEITRNRHPDPFIFTLIDKPISAEEYDMARQNDYLPTGFFNTKLIVRILKGDETWIYNGHLSPPAIEMFRPGQSRHVEPFRDDVAAQLQEIFDIEKGFVADAFEVLARQARDAA